ncbi:hypothetical protein PMAN_a2950 [Pseudoalteromonas marina]|nr:hypothetical protein PMAN_a2950 [Pseudoalteromonas marina]
MPGGLLIHPFYSPNILSLFSIAFAMLVHIWALKVKNQ